jgi:hypothetical protein
LILRKVFLLADFEVPLKRVEEIDEYNGWKSFPSSRATRFLLVETFIIQLHLPEQANQEAHLMDEEAAGKKVEFVTISAEKIPFGRNNFIEVARKKAITDEGENEFISLSRGYYLPDGSERFKKSLTIPDDPQIKAFVVQKISSM